MEQPTTPRHHRPSRWNRFLFGVVYYPEHWTTNERRDDVRLMAEAGVNTVRMAEFAWDRMEPEEGVFDFSFFDEAIRELSAVGISTVLCTPTAAPPRWLTEAHPDWLRVDADGRTMVHGSRQHVCTTHPGFREASRRITLAMAEHFSGNRDVIGWQTDNELNCHFRECHCEACQSAFRQWLEAKHGGVAALNAAWGTIFWSQTYDRFEQVRTPLIDRPTHPNPSQQLDYFRFLSDAVVSFHRDQTGILREANRNWWITHNGMFPRLDYWKLAGDLDFLGIDVYPGFADKTPEAYAWAACLFEDCRAVSGTFVVPEQQAGPGGQRPYLHRTPQPGQMRLWAGQAGCQPRDAFETLLHRSLKDVERLEGFLTLLPAIVKGEYKAQPSLARTTTTRVPSEFQRPAA